MQVHKFLLQEIEVILLFPKTKHLRFYWTYLRLQKEIGYVINDWHVKINLDKLWTMKSEFQEKRKDNEKFPEAA